MSVVGPLPLVDARVEVPPSSVAPQDEANEPAPSAAAPPQPAKRDGKAGAAAPEPVVQAVSAVALKGQVLKWWLNIANTGASSRLWILRHRGGAGGLGDKEGTLLC